MSIKASNLYPWSVIGTVAFLRLLGDGTVIADSVAATSSLVLGGYPNLHKLLDDLLTSSGSQSLLNPQLVIKNIKRKFQIRCVCIRFFIESLGVEVTLVFTFSVLPLVGILLLIVLYILTDEPTENLALFCVKNSR